MNLAEFHESHSKAAGSSSQAQVVGFTGDSSLIERLKEMGLHQGLQVTAVGRAPFGGPLLFRFGNTVLALRKEEAQCTLIQKL